MLKRLHLLALCAVGILALAMPTAAQAVPLATTSEGIPAEHFTATSTNAVITTATLGKIECATFKLTLTITENSTTTVHGFGNGSALGTPGKTPHQGECTSGLAMPINFTTITVDTIDDKIDGTGTLVLETTFDITHPFPLNIMCKFAGSAGITYKAGTDTFKIEGNLAGKENFPPCPGPEGNQISGDFTLTDENGLPVIIG